MKYCLREHGYLGLSFGSRWEKVTAFQLTKGGNHIAGHNEMDLVPAVVHKTVQIFECYVLKCFCFCGRMLKANLQNSRPEGNIPAFLSERLRQSTRMMLPHRHGQTVYSFSKDLTFQ